MILRAALAVFLALAAAVPAGAAPDAPAAPMEAAGPYPDAALAAYVTGVGQRLLAADGRPGERWTFTVLDTPESNAFALPGRRIVVTRGMLALANDEAELAVVLAHEIGHATAGHIRVGQRVADRRAAELEADRLGIAMVARAGYDPAAQVGFLGTLAASLALDARLGGRRAATVTAARGGHPALADRLRQARRDAGRLGPGARDRPTFLAAIDGLVWGDGPAQGFMRGRSFVHPDLGFALDAPAGYDVVNRPDAVVASGPGGAMLLLDSLPDPGGGPAAYLARDWVPGIARSLGAGTLQGLREGRVNGLATARASLTLATRDSARVAELTVVRYRGRLYRVTGLRAPDDQRAAAALSAAAASFRPLSAAEAARAGPLRIRIHRIARGDDVAAMARGMPVGDAAQARFDLLNGLGPGSSLRVGDLVKLVSY